MFGYSPLFIRVKAKTQSEDWVFGKFVLPRRLSDAWKLTVVRHLAEANT
jgi:hypothetical protein